MESPESEIKFLNQEAGSEEKQSQSAENFQKFIYELCDKNGILSDLRAYLRSHIVNILKNAQSGVPLTCQKHFTQRLGLTFQALNILIAEYLLRMEFSYTLSVFASEIPLANMVFDYAKSLLKNEVGIENRMLKFSECDIWSVLNYLGVKCDSVHAMSILEMYKNDENASLLECILKCCTLHHAENTYYMESGALSDISLSSSVKSSNTAAEANVKCPRQESLNDHCNHYVFCQACHNKMVRMRDKYQKKKKHIAKNLNLNSDMESMLKTITVVEQNVIDEMFQQLKGVYEAEVEMVKQEEDIKVKRSLAIHAFELQKHRSQLEANFKHREAELERNIEEKKKFLWGLAKNLRTQHQQMSKAMDAVKHETNRLSAKEKHLKGQLNQAEEFLRKRGEEMRKQISNELSVLERHLESMKHERDDINKERLELEQLKNFYNKNSNVKNNEIHEDIRTHYSVLKDELSVLRKYIETAKPEPKCVVERSTLTELNNVTSKITIVLNNDQGVVSVNRNECEVRRPNQVRNDLKKPKNVNFGQLQHNLDEFGLNRTESNSRSEVSHSGEVQTPYVQQLCEENHQLRSTAAQQREQIEELYRQQTRLHSLISSQTVPATPAPLSRHIQPLAPDVAHTDAFIANSSSRSANSFGWRKGAGEELTLCTDPQPRILLPGDTLPFIGVLSDRRNDMHRRHLLRQWRELRRSISPQVRTSSPMKERRPRPASAEAALSATRSSLVAQDQPNVTFSPSVRETPTQRCKASLETKQNREKSPKSMLREAKEKLRNPPPKNELPTTSSIQKREKSPGAVLREAKLRLRKLEIEAEAVEQSYRDFRIRQERKIERQAMEDETVVTKDIGKEIDNQRSRSLLRNKSNRPTLESFMSAKEEHDEYKLDINKYLKSFETEYGYDITQYINKNNSVHNSKPIPNAFSELPAETDSITKQNFLETPLTEFRKYYTSDKSRNKRDEIKNSNYTKSRDTSRTDSPISILKSPVGYHNRQTSKEDIKLNQTDEKLQNSDVSKIGCSVSVLKSPDKRDTNEKSIDKGDEFNLHEMSESRTNSRIDKTSDPPVRLTTSIRSRDESDTNSEIRKINDSFKTVTPLVPLESFVTNDSFGNKLKIPESIIQYRNDKQAEYKILKDNVNKIYNIKDDGTDTVYDSDIDKMNIRKVDDIEERLPISSPEKRVIEKVVENDENLLRIEINNTSDTTLKMKDSDTSEIVVVVNSIVEPSENVVINNTNFQQTVIVSPKRNVSTDALNQHQQMRINSPLRQLSSSPEAEANRTKNNVVDDIFTSVNKDRSQDENMEGSDDVAKDYQDDFSADVDNYNSKTDVELSHSPISLLKSSEDENFWD